MAYSSRRKYKKHYKKKYASKYKKKYSARYSRSGFKKKYSGKSVLKYFSVPQRTDGGITHVRYPRFGYARVINPHTLREFFVRSDRTGAYPPPFQVTPYDAQAYSAYLAIRNGQRG